MYWQGPGPERIGFTERDFKVCDLCGALNPVANDECFVCRWNGRFHTDRETIRDAMNELAGEHGAISESLFAQEVVPSTPPRMGFWAEVWHSMRRAFSRA